MSQSGPFRQRPNLHLALRLSTASPLQKEDNPSFSTPTHSNLPTPGGTPLGTTAYSPFRSAGLKPPTPFEGARSPKHRKFRHMQDRAYRRRHLWWRFLGSKAIWLSFLAILMLTWWINFGGVDLDAVKLSASGFGRDLVYGRSMQGFQFYPASSPKIHYTGRWTSTPNRLRKDGTFPGVYFDIKVANTTTLLLALHNNVAAQTHQANDSLEDAPPDPKHFSFRPISASSRAAPPISLLARIDDDEYVLLPNSTLLVPVCMDSLEAAFEHRIRIVAPMNDDVGHSILELEGLWLSEGGSLVKVDGSSNSEDFADEDSLEAENDAIGEAHREGLRNIDDPGDGRFNIANPAELEDSAIPTLQERKKVLEVVTDYPGSLTSRSGGRRPGKVDSLLSGVMGWEYLIGEMFGTDHVGVNVDGMCLIQDCIGGAGYPAGIGDVFFRSGPYGSEYFQHSWTFSPYVPDVLVLSIGSADHTSFTLHQEQYNKTYFDLSARFESTYVSLIQGIRRLAYPRHPAILYSERLGAPGIIPPNTPAAIPIFIMRPLRGQLEQSTQNVVAQLRADGDKSVFWLDTSGWLAPDPEAGDFTHDPEESDPSHSSVTANPDHADGTTTTTLIDDSKKDAALKWRLTQQGNQRVAIFLHMHVCRYLAAAEEKCPFLPQEVYQGKVFDPEEANFNRHLENEKERKLKKLFWEDDDDDDADEKVEDVGEVLGKDDWRDV